ncbi:MAG: GNAT family N-acetyltransferase [Cyanobacteria bacterium J06638_28]
MSEPDPQPFIFKHSIPLDLTALAIEGERVILRSLNDTYATAIFTEFTADITRYMLPKPAETIQDTLAFITESVASMQAQTDLVLAITHSEGEFLGCCGLHLTQGPRTPELGIWLKQAAHGNGYGREAIATLMAWAVRNIDFDYAIYPVDKANIASRKIPESLGGFVFSEKKVKAMTGNILDEVVYKIPSATLSSRQQA